MRALGTSVLAGLVLAAPLMPHTTAAPWAGDCEAAWCGKVSAAPADDGGLRRILGERAADAIALAQPGCSSVDAWASSHAGQLPRSMYVRGAAGLAHVRWAYPAPVGTFVIAVCAR